MAYGIMQSKLVMLGVRRINKRDNEQEEYCQWVFREKIGG